MDGLMYMCILTIQTFIVLVNLSCHFRCSVIVLALCLPGRMAVPMPIHHIRVAVNFEE